MHRRAFLSSLMLTGAMASPSLALVKPRRKVTAELPLLVLDPGHGGRDPGAIGVGGVYEKNIVLDIANRLAGELKGLANIRLTREDDRFLPLEDRVAFARENRANLFLSIHADSAPSAEARGLSVYTLSATASDGFAAKLADGQNIVDQRFGARAKQPNVQVSDILFDLTAQQTVSAAHFAQKRLLSGAKEGIRLLENPARAANFVVLRAPDVPSLLIETGFLSNPLDEAALNDAATRSRMAGILGRNIAALLQDPLFS